jgi:hypothetical protein
MVALIHSMILRACAYCLCSATDAGLYLGGQLTLLPVLAVLSTFCAHTLEKHMRDDFMLRCDIAQVRHYTILYFQ